MDRDQVMSRRQILRVTAVLGSTVTAVAVSDGIAQADTDTGTDPASPVASPDRAQKRADLASVASISGQTVSATPVDGGEAVTVPLVGFPAGFAPRAGDRLAVTDQWPGIALAAIPLCHWVSGVPKRQANGEFVVAGQRIASSRLLEVGRLRSVQVCLLDTDLPTAQALAVRG
ncbi:MAG TPA: hypothetical protein VF062_25255 [Candidatus Limnocylindrales bacterium]